MKNLLFLLAGGVIGFFAGRCYYAKKYKDIADKQISEMEEYYKRVDEYARKPDESEKDDQNESRENGILPKDKRDAMRKDLFNNASRSDSVNYKGMYKNKKEVDPAELEHPEDDQNDEEDNPEKEAFEEHRKNMNKPPRIISAEHASNLPMYIESECLFFYTYDEILCDENEDPIDEPERLIGDSLTKYGFADSNEKTIYVLNYAMDTCYEIQKLDESWTDTH